MSSRDENLYRGDPPPEHPPAPRSDCSAFDPARWASGPPPVPGSGPQTAPPPYGGAPQPPPGYGPPGYGPPPGYPPAFYRPPTNTMAILALVLAFVFAPAGLILGIMARKQIRQTREEGDGLALAGIIVGGIVTGIYVLLIAFWIIAFAALTNSGSFGP